MLSAPLYSEVSPDFFRVLCGANARVYVDALDTLWREMGEASSGLSRQEALEIVLEVVERYAGLRPEEEPVAGTEDFGSPRGQANIILNRLTATGWLAEPARADYQRIVHLESAAETVLEALRRIAMPEVQFTDKLLLVCTTLTNPEAFHDNAWSDLESCIANARTGLQELRGMQKSIERMTRRQLAAETLRENLSVLYDEFSEAIGHGCYRELVRVRLPIRLKQSCRRLEEVENDSFALEQMQKEVLRRQIAADPTAAISHVRVRIRDLFLLLEAIEPQAELMDRRAAEFARRSFARFRYLQEIGSARREQIQAVFETVNRRHAGERISDIETETELPPVYLSDARLIGGLESLYLPRRRAALGEMDPIDEDATDDERDDCLLEMEGNLRDSLTVFRANRFVEDIEFNDAGWISSEDLSIPTGDEVTDVAALLLHAGSADAAYRVLPEREREDIDKLASDRKAGFLIERFELHKK